MNTEEIRKGYRAQPFKPFVIRVADGREYLVRHPEFLSFSTSGRVIYVSTPDDTHEAIDALMIRSIHTSERKTRDGRRGKD